MANFTWNAEEGCLTIHDPLFNRDTISAEYPPYRQPAANAATTLLPIPSFSIEGARGHSKLINGEYRQVDGEWPGRLVFVNSVDMYLWPFAGRWRIGRHKNVGTLTCRLYTQCSASGYPDDLPATRGEQGWMENDGGLDGGSFVQSSAVHLVLSSAGKTARRARRAAAAELEAPLGAACAAADSRLAATLAEAVAHVVRSEESGGGATPPLLPRPSDGASASASAALPRASVIARLEVGVNADGEEMQAVWGSACNLTLRRILAETEGLQLGRVSVAGIISRPRDVAGLAASLTPTCGVTALDLGGCRVGLFGLRALLAAAARCESLETVDLFHVGPSFDGMHSEGGSLGCWCTAEPASSSPDCVLLLELCEILVLRGGSGVSNEALLDDCSGGGALYRAKRELAARCGM